MGTASNRTKDRQQFGLWRSQHGLDAHRKAVETELPAVAHTLLDVIGQQLADYAAGLRDPKALKRYASGAQRPQPKTERRLRDAFQVVSLVSTFDSPAVVRAWLIGANPMLNDEAPVEFLHQGKMTPAVRAAEAFVLDG